MQAHSANFTTTIAGNDVETDVACTILLPITRRNLCPNPRSVWSAYGWQASLSGTGFGPGASGMGIGWAVSGSSQTATMLIATRPGSTYTAQAKLQPNGGSGTITGGVALGVLGIGQATPLTSGGQQLTSYTFVATAYATAVGFITQGATSGFTDTIVTQFMVEESATLGTYFDGDTAGASWDGTPGQSTSTLNTDPYPDLTLAVESVDITRQLTTDLPDSTKSEAGYSAAGGTLVLSGLVDQTDATKTAVWLFNPESTDSPLYRLQPNGGAVVISAGVANQSPSELLPLITGSIAKVDTDPAAGTVTIEVVDSSGDLYATPSFPGVGAVMSVQSPAGTSLVLMNPGLTALWALDWVLRANHIWPNTSPRPGCGFYASMCGGAFPQIYGSGSMPQADQSAQYADENSGNPPTLMQFVAGKWTPQVCRDAAHACSLAVPIILNGTGAGWHAEFAMNGTIPAVTLFSGGVFPPTSVTLGVNTGGTLSNLTSFSLTPVSGTTWAFAANDFVAHNVTVPAGQHVFDVQVVGSVFTLYMDGTQLGQWTSTVAPPSVTANYIETSLPYGVEALQVTNETNGIPRTIPAPGASFGASLNMLNAIPDPGTNDVWQIVQQIAQAEGAIAGFNEAGLFTFTNRDSIGTGASVRTIASTASLKSLTFDQDSARLANHITLPVNALQASAWGAVWSGQGNRQTKNGVYYLPAYGTDTLQATWSDPAIVGTMVGVIPAGGVKASQPLSGYRAATAADGSGSAVSNLQITITQTSPTSATISITNPNRYTVYFATPSGYPTAQGTPQSFVLAGQTFTAATVSPEASNTSPGQMFADSQWPPVAEGGAASNRFGEKLLQLPANSWVQNLASAQTFTDDLLGELYMAKPFWQNVGIVLDPSLQLADRVTVLDPDASGLNDDAIIATLHTTIDKNSWNQDVDLRAVARPGYLQLGVPGKSELGSAYV